MRNRAFLSGFVVAFAFSAVVACVGEDVGPIPMSEPVTSPARTEPADAAAGDVDELDPPDAIVPPPVLDAGDGGGDGGCDTSPPSKLAQPCGAGGAACEGLADSCCKGPNAISCVTVPSTCTGGGGAVLECTKSADCTVAGKKACCAGLVVPKDACAAPSFRGGSTCRASCAVNETALCVGTLLDCPASKPTCLGATVSVGKDSVRIGRCVATTP